MSKPMTSAQEAKLKKALNLAKSVETRLDRMDTTITELSVKEEPQTKQKP